MTGGNQVGEPGDSKAWRMRRASICGLVLVGLAAVAWWHSPRLNGLSEDRADGAEELDARLFERGLAMPDGPHSTPVPARKSERPPPLWRAIDQAAVGALPPYDEKWSKEGRALVRMSADLASAKALQAGDQLTISVPQLREVRSSTIEEVSDGAGARSLLGVAEWDDGRPQRWVVTVGSTSLFAWIDTPAGPHELAIRGGYGWLVPSANKMAGFDFSEPDYFVIDRGGRRVKPGSGG